MDRCVRRGQHSLKTPQRPKWAGQVGVQERIRLKARQRDLISSCKPELLLLSQVTVCLKMRRSHSEMKYFHIYHLHFSNHCSKASWREIFIFPLRAISLPSFRWGRTVLGRYEIYFIFFSFFPFSFIGNLFSLPLMVFFLDIYSGFRPQVVFARISMFPNYIKLTEFANQHITWDAEVARKLCGSVPLATFGFSVGFFCWLCRHFEWHSCIVEGVERGQGGVGVTYGWSSALVKTEFQSDND